MKNEHTEGIIPYILNNCDKIPTKPLSEDDFINDMLNVDMGSKPRGMWWRGKYYENPADCKEFVEMLKKEIKNI